MSDLLSILLASGSLIVSNITKYHYLSASDAREKENRDSECLFDILQDISVTITTIQLPKNIATIALMGYTTFRIFDAFKKATFKRAPIYNCKHKN